MENLPTDPNNSSPCKRPSNLWCLYQALKGANSSKLTIPDVDMSGAWVLISGGNSGIGREASLQFAKWGANVVMACRPNPPPREPHPASVVDECKDAAKAAGKENSTIEYWEVDLASVASVEALAKRWLETGRPLDILCNNAGVSSIINKVVITKDGFELVHQVNFLSHVIMTLSLLPALAKATAPRILCTTSNMQYFGSFNFKNANRGRNRAYPNNKLYFQTWLTELHCHLARNPKYAHIVIHGMHPGYVQTNIWEALTKENLAAMDWMSWVLVKLLPYLGIDSQQGSLCITHAASSPALALKNLDPDAKDGTVGAKFLNRIWECEPMPQTRHPGCRAMVWDFVDGELGLGEKGLLEGL